MPTPARRRLLSSPVSGMRHPKPRGNGEWTVVSVSESYIYRDHYRTWLQELGITHGSVMVTQLLRVMQLSAIAYWSVLVCRTDT